MKIIKIENCSECPFVLTYEKSHSNLIENHCFAQDEENLDFIGYTRKSNEKPQRIPDWCPLTDMK